MELFRCIVLTFFNALLLVNAAVIRERRFGSNYYPGFGKRDSYLPGYGKRPYLYETGSVQGREKDKSMNSAYEPKTPYWGTMSYQFPYWDEPEYRYPYETLTRRNVESVRSNVHPVEKYNRINPDSLPYRFYSHGIPFLEDVNEKSLIKKEGRLVSDDNADTYSNTDDDFTGNRSEGFGRQNPADRTEKELTQLLVKLLSKTGQDNSYRS